MRSIRFFERTRRPLSSVAALLFVACGSEAPRVETQTVSAPVEVVKSVTLPETRITTGTVRSTTVSPLAAKVMGNVTRVLVVEGQRVHAGDLLVEIDDREGRAKTTEATAGASAVEHAIAAAQANADLMATTYQRFAALHERGSVSAQEFDEVAAKNSAAQAQLRQAIAQRTQARGGVSEAETFLSYARVRSPINGIVTARMIDPGAQAAPGMPLLKVEDDAHYRVETTVDETLPVRIGDSVTIDGTLAARVSNIVPAVDPATRSSVVKIDLPPGSGLRSGAFARVAFTIGSRSGITVPSRSIARRGQLTSVSVVDGNGIARMRLVTLGEPQGERVEVLSGVDAGEKVVLRSNIRDGAHVIPSVSEGTGRVGGRNHVLRATRPAGSLATLGMTQS